MMTRAGQIAFVSLFAFLFFATAAACTRSGSSGAVEAPMTSADASAAEIALVRDQPNGGQTTELEGDNHGGAPFRVGERWTGSYNCAQGKTDLVLIFEEVGHPTRGVNDEEHLPVAVIFEFAFDGQGNSGFGSADGVARMRGRYEPKTRRLLLRGDEWIDQPANYQLINFVGLVNRSTGGYTGTVEGPGCTTFSASPDKTPAVQPPRRIPPPVRRP